MTEDREQTPQEIYEAIVAETPDFESKIPKLKNPIIKGSIMQICQAGPKVFDHWLTQVPDHAESLSQLYDSVEGDKTKTAIAGAAVWNYGQRKMQGMEVSAEDWKDFLNAHIENLSGFHFLGSVQFPRKIPYRIIFSDATFAGDVYFSGMTFSKEVNFSRAKFLAGAYFSGVTFCDRAGFVETTFNLVFFSEVIFSAWVIFSAAKFSHEADFSGVTFSDKAFFSATIFSAGAVFSEVEFPDEASFLEAMFFEKANFTKAKFSAEADFSKAKFSDKAHFSEVVFSGLAYFGRVTFLDKVYFAGATFSGRAYFSGLTFPRLAGFAGAVFAGETDFAGSVFARAADFAKAKFCGETYFLNTEFKSHTIFRRCVFQKEPPRFHNATLHQDTSFLKAKWPRAKELQPGKGESREDLLDEWQHSYRTLKLAFAQHQSVREEQEFGRLEMEVEARLMRHTRKWGKASYLTLYGLLADYGYSAKRPGVWLLGLSAVGLVLALGGMDCSWDDAVRLSLSYTLPPFNLLKKTADSGYWFLWFEAQRLLSYLCWFLIGLAWRNQAKSK